MSSLEMTQGYFIHSKIPNIADEWLLKKEELENE